MLASLRKLVNGLGQAFDRYQNGPDQKTVTLDDGTVLPFVRQPQTQRYLLHTAPGEMITQADGIRESWAGGYITRAVLPDQTILKDFSVSHMHEISASMFNPADMMNLQRELGWRTKEHPDGSVTTRTHNTSVERREYPDGKLEFSYLGFLGSPALQEGPYTLNGFSPGRIHPDGHREYWHNGFKFAEVTPEQTEIFHSSDGSRLEIAANQVRTAYNTKGQIEQITYPDGTVDKYEAGQPTLRYLGDSSVIQFDVQGQGFKLPTFAERSAAYAPLNELTQQAVKEISIAAVQGQILPALLTTAEERAQGRLAGLEDIQIFNQVGTKPPAGPTDPFNSLLQSIGGLTTRVGTVLREAMENPEAPARQHPLIDSWANRVGQAEQTAEQELQARPMGRYQRLNA